jgi:hypothetical protein
MLAERTVMSREKKTWILPTLPVICPNAMVVVLMKSNTIFISVLRSHFAWLFNLILHISPHCPSPLDTLSFSTAFNFHSTFRSPILFFKSSIPDKSYTSLHLQLQVYFPGNIIITPLGPHWMSCYYICNYFFNDSIPLVSKAMDLY